MKLAIMQPYFFPYIGYFQLIHAADTFVVYDDVNYIKGGWVNRNFILGQGAPQRFTLPLLGASPNLHINQINVAAGHQKLLKTIVTNYSKAPYFASTYRLAEEILGYSDANLGNYLYHSLKRICENLRVETQLTKSSLITKDNSLRGADKVINICTQLGSKSYINSIGGKMLYDKSFFLERGIELSFIESRTRSYRQYGNNSVPNLSILDVMMFNSVDKIGEMLDSYELV